jgi:hypothetical protein
MTADSFGPTNAICQRCIQLVRLEEQWGPGEVEGQLGKVQREGQRLTTLACKPQQPPEDLSNKQSVEQKLSIRNKT